ncbi:hypothetical protein R3P38DRAFT_2778424 [Favolaschia claudopus]|uniref:Uncharacterized protein n=1 Tax=Favolaschia claudopus TaxID=2862362 RepID=A0AAW0BI20_9AGAR
MPPRTNRNDNANAAAAAAAAPQDPQPAGRTTRSSAQAVAGPSRPNRGRTTASRTVSDQESRGFAPLSCLYSRVIFMKVLTRLNLSNATGGCDNNTYVLPASSIIGYQSRIWTRFPQGIAADTSIRLSIWFVCVIASFRLADEYTIKGSTPNPATDDPRTPSRAHRVANELASRLAQNTAMASPGPRQRDRRSYAHTTESSESEEFPVIQRAPRRLARAPGATAANALSLNVSGSDSDDSFDPSQPAVQPAPEPAPQPAHRAPAGRRRRGTEPALEVVTPAPPQLPQQQTVVRPSIDNDGFVWMNEDGLAALALASKLDRDHKTNVSSVVFAPKFIREGRVLPPAETT